jgi:hypothetical protein
MATMAHSQKATIENSVIRFFDGLSTLSTDSLKAYTTPDFLLLEDGALWNMDTLVSRIAPFKGQAFKRVNRFDFVRTEWKGDRAWTSYWNTADMLINNNPFTVSWLESAVLVKQQGRWRIQMLHSTRLHKEGRAK